MSLANDIREFAYSTRIEPALKRSAEPVSVRAGDIHSRMGLQNRLPAVCAALGSQLMQQQYGLTLIVRQGPHAGSNVIFHFLPVEGAGAVSSPPRTPADSLAVGRSASPAQQSFHANDDSLFLVACVKTKRSSPSEAKDLYCSDWFQSARRLVESRGAKWLILSAKHGVITPEARLEPYEDTLKGKPSSYRRRWAERAAEDVSRRAPRGASLIVLAGSAYAEFLVPELRSRGFATTVPLAGLRQGEQLSWLKRHV